MDIISGALRAGIGRGLFQGDFEVLAGSDGEPATPRLRFYQILILRFGFLGYAPPLMETAKLEVQHMPGTENGCLVQVLNGKLCLETVHSFVQTMRQEQAKDLVLDMSGVSFLDSSGVGALVSCFVNRQHAGKTTALAGLTRQGSAVLQVSGVMKLIPTYPTVEEAVRSRSQSA